MEHFLSTSEAAKLIGIKPCTLAAAIWNGRITPPQKGPGGIYLWNKQDIEAAKKAFKCRAS